MPTQLSARRAATARAAAQVAARPTLTVDLAAVAANTRLLARRTTGELMAVVKAEGFGHGAHDVARTALDHGATRLGVAGIGEALPLRHAGIDAPLLSWLNPVDADWATAVAHGIDLAVPGVEHLEALLRVTSGARVHLQLDTGLARDGSSPTAWAALCRAARRAVRAGRLRVVGVMGHLACADEPRHRANVDGRARFAWGVATARACGLDPRQRHLAATSATLNDPLTHHTMSRVGAGLVGIDPSRTTALRPALTLTAPLVEVREVRAGTPVGYGHTWTAPTATRLGLLPVGYGDGLPRVASGRAEVVVAGRRRPLVGRISMDSAVVDLGCSTVGAGAVVQVLGGEGPTLQEWADWSDTLEHEIVTGLGARLARTTRPVAPRSRW